MTDEQTTGIGGDMGNSGTDSGETQANAETSTHYATLEEADAAARKFQGEYDKAKAQLNALGGYAELKKHGSPEEIDAFISQLLSRPDFQDYAAGKLSPQEPNGSSDDDEFLTDEQREIRELKQQLAAQKQAHAGSESRVNTELAELRFERAEKVMDEQFGDLWRDKRDDMLSRVRDMTKNGTITNPEQITPKVLMTAFLSSTTDSPDEMWAFMTKAVQQKDQAFVERQNQLATSSPNTGRTAGTPEKEIKSFADAFEAGKNDLARAQSRGS